MLVLAALLAAAAVAINPAHRIHLPPEDVATLFMAQLRSSRTRDADLAKVITAMTLTDAGFYALLQRQHEARNKTDECAGDKYCALCQVSWDATVVSRLSEFVPKEEC